MIENHKNIRKTENCDLFFYDLIRNELIELKTPSFHKNE